MILQNSSNNIGKDLHQKAVSLIQAGNAAEAVPLLKDAIQAMPYEALLYNHLGQALMITGDRDEAMKVFETAFDLDPNNMNTLNNLGVLAVGQKNYEQARSYLERSVELHSVGNVGALINLGIVYAELRMYQQAEETLRRALKLKPDDYKIKRNLALALYYTNKVDETRALCEQLLEQEPEDIGMLHRYANLLVRSRDRGAAIKVMERILEIDPANEKAWIDMATNYEHMGKIEEAKKVIADAAPHCHSAGYYLAVARVAQHDKDADLAAIADEFEANIKDADPYQPSNASAFYELGRIFDKAGAYDKAFSYFEIANRCQSTDPAVPHADSEAYRRELERFKDVYTKDWVASWTSPVPYDEAPEMVFLIGFPRSGTTLLDQILHSHPDIEVAEEFPALGDLLTYISRDLEQAYPQALAELPEAEIKKLRKQYFDFQRSEGVQLDRKIFVDKLPLNIIHAGLIYRVFPNAKFILALRHPCDCSLSCYMQNFQINPAMSNYLDLENTAELYDIVFSLWERYEDLLPLNVHRIKYEDVIADFKPTVASLLEFLDVPWDDAVLEYDKTARERGPINTPSYNQVTQKIYTRAKGRWERYRKHMEPVLGTLLPWAEKHGYEPAEE